MVLKLKIIKKYRKLLFLFALLLLTGSSFFVPKPADAQTTTQSIKPQDIEITTTVLINGKPDNLIRVVKDSSGKIQTVPLTVILRFNKPAKGFVVDQDNLDFNQLSLVTSVAEYFTGTKTGIIKGFGVGLDSAYQGNTCKSILIQTGITANDLYYRCDFKSQSAATEKTVVSGTDYSFNFELTSPSLQTFEFSSATGTPMFRVYPYIKFGSGLRTANLTFNAAAKEIYVQTFASQADLEKAEREGIRPLDVPNYGSNTGTGKAYGTTGDPILALINQVIGLILGLLQEIVYLIFYWLVAPIIQAMLSIRTYTDSFAGIIYPGWELIRNMSNILFIVALIAIGLATLFRVESYQFKHLLVQLIIAALLVNFSLVISQAILGLADTMQSQFLPNNTEVIRSLAKDLMVGYRTQILNLEDFAARGTFTVLAQQLFWLSLSLGSFAVFCAIAVFLVIRIVALWVLLMTSPIAYIAGVLPATHHYRQEWWNYFLKYAFFTPIMAFFLNMTALMLNLQKNNPVLKQLMTNPESLGTGTFTSFILGVASNILLLVFLIISLKVADEFGILGAHAITSMAQKGIYAPFAGVGWLGQRGAGWLGRYWNEKTTHWFLEGHEGEKAPGKFKRAMFAIANPRAFAKGWEARSHELKHEAQEVAEAGGREVAEQFLTGGRLKIPYRQFTERKHENDFLKDYENMRKESLMHSALEAEKIGGVEGEVRRRAIVKAAAKNGYLDDLLRMKHFANQYADADGTFYSAEVLNRFLFGYLGNSEQALRFMAEDMESLGKDTGHYEYLGHAYYDPDAKTFKRGMEVVGTEETGRQDVEGKGSKVEKLKNTWQVGFAIGELKKVGGRQRAGIAPHNLVSLRAKVAGGDKGELLVEGEEIKDAEFGKADGTMDEYQRAAIQIYDAATLRDAHFAQSRMKEWVLSKEVDQNTGEVIIDSLDDYNRIAEMWRENQSFVKQMYAQITGLEPKNVTGIPIVMFDQKTGKRITKTIGGAEPLRLGELKSMDLPVGLDVAPEILKNKDIDLRNVDKEDKDRLATKLPDVITKAFVGNRPEVQVRADLTAITGKLTPVQVEQIKDDIYNKLLNQIEQKYNPYPVIYKIDREMKTRYPDLKGKTLTPAQISDINKALLTAAQTAFRNNAKAGSYNFSTIRPEVEREINKLKSDPKYAKTAIQKIGSDEIDVFTRHIEPVI